MCCPSLEKLPSPSEGKFGWPWTEEISPLPEVMPDGNSWPKISIVTPSYNQGQFIEETIRSVLLQGYPNLEYIIIDGGSTDNSVEIIKKYEPWLTYWHSKKDKGQADAINQGMNDSSGQIVAWLNSDDIYLPGTLFHIAKRLYGHTEKCSLVYGDAINLLQSKRKDRCGPQYSEKFDTFKITYRDLIVQPSAFWTRKLWESAGELDIRYNYVFDWEWFIRASTFGNFEYVSRFNSIFRYHGKQKTLEGGADRRREIIEVVKKYSSAYWINLYLLIEKHYQRIKKRLRTFKKLKIPRKKSILPMTFPDIGSTLKNKQDFYMVLSMYDAHDYQSK